jgi:hypothetical protein
MNDPVTKPAHYHAGAIEVIDVIESFDLNFRTGNAAKYLLRAGHKGDAIEDLKKARQYIGREIARREGKAGWGDEPERPPILYLATPYTRYPGGLDRAFEAAARLAARLMRAGHHVYSPIAHTHPLAIHGKIDPRAHAIWMPFDEAMMHAANGLVVAHMNGWRVSRGIAEEVAFFEQHRKPIFDLEVGTLKMRQRNGT